MSSEERRKILQMVADGKISAEEAAALMRALDEDSAGDEPQVIPAQPSRNQERSEAPEIDAVKRRAFRFSNAILTIGILFTVLFAWGMFAIQQNAGLNFWFYCFSLPLFFGILLIAIGAGSK
ncbi:MAG: SHOCT-like domain-containing protein, partial [Anaerolineales bacterium]